VSLQDWQQVLVSQQADGTALTASVTETSILHASGKYILGGGVARYVGQAWRLRAMGRISNVVTSPGTLTFRVKFGSVAVASSGALALNIVAKTNVTWILDWDLLLRTVGSGTAATFMHSGAWQSESVIGSPAAGAGGASSHIIPASAPAVGTGFDSTIDNIIDLTAQWGTNNANSIQCHTYKLESLN
jgi:hypothetical protein